MNWKLAIAFLLLSSSSMAAVITPTDLQQRIGIDPHVGGRVPLRTPFRDEQGATHNLGEVLAGRPAILALVYFNCPNLCSVTLDSLSRSVARASLDPATDYRVIAISIDPREGPAQADAWQSAHRDYFGKAEWHFLTGNDASIRSVAQSLGYRYFWDAGQAQYAHPAGAVVVSSTGHVVDYLNGVEFPTAELRHALSLATENRSGNLADQFWLVCYHYQALTGQYGGEIALALRTLALATILALGFLLFRLLRTRA
jgi:protein SCO1/2